MKRDVDGQPLPLCFSCLAQSGEMSGFLLVINVWRRKEMSGKQGGNMKKREVKQVRLTSLYR